METFALFGAILGIVLVVEFFYIGYLVSRIRDNSSRISTQLNQLLQMPDLPARYIEPKVSPSVPGLSPEGRSPYPIRHLGWKIFAAGIIIYSALATITYLAGWIGGR